MAQCIEQNLPYCLKRVLWHIRTMPIVPYYCFHLHMSTDKHQSSLQHLGDSTFKSLIVDKSLFTLTNISNTESRYNNRCYTQLWEILLGICSKYQQTCNRRSTIIGHPLHLQQSVIVNVR